METVPNKDVQLAFDFVRYTNRNVFLTGKAGTGKTTFLHELKRTSPKRMVVLAPTGVAAINAGGVTIHSFFLLPFHPYVPSIYLSGSPGKTSEQRENTGYKMNRERINIIKSLDLLVIDEISMVRADTLDAIDATLRKYKNHHLPFGGVQLLMIGDLQQLAPVVKEEDLLILRDYYKVLFFFGSKALASTNYVTIELKHIYRQDDQVFIDLLNKVRNNNIDKDVLTELNKRHIPDFDTDADGGYITLTTHNYQAQAINDSRLEKLPGSVHSFNAVITNEFPESSYPNAYELILKKGAQVMFVKNDSSSDKLYFNGKIGKIEGFENDVIIVKCPEDYYSIRVEPVEWQNVKYSLDDETKEIQETVIGTFTQYPLKLAWAITIHKSQGLTFERAVIDARSAFAHGQVYVALSRCRSLKGLVLNRPLNQQAIIDDPVVNGFVKDSEQNQPGQKDLDESRKIYELKLLSELFDFTPISRNLGYCIKLINEHHYGILGNPETILENALSCFRTDITEVSEKFAIQISRLCENETGAESNILLQERIKKAAEYFYEKIVSSLDEILQKFSIESDNKTIKKSFKVVYDRFKKETFSKIACLNSAKKGFNVAEYLEAKAKAEIEIPENKSKNLKDAEDTSGVVLHQSLFRRLKEWRNLKAKELDVPHYVIIHQKTLVGLTNSLPQSLTAIRKIKGMGKMRSERYGEELLEIILSFCQDEKIEPSDDQIQASPTKKKKGDSKKITLALLNEGKSVPEIAEERGLSQVTVESHLAYFVGRGEIEVSRFVPAELLDIITKSFEGNDELRMGPVKESLGDKVTWGDLRFVTSYLRYIRRRD